MFATSTYKWKVSLNLGDQLLFLDLVWNFRFLSLRCGPMMLTSTKGRNMPDVCHFKSLAPITDREKKKTEKKKRLRRLDGGVRGSGLTDL